MDVVRDEGVLSQPEAACLDDNHRPHVVVGKKLPHTLRNARGFSRDVAQKLVIRQRPDAVPVEFVVECAGAETEEFCADVIRIRRKTQQECCLVEAGEGVPNVGDARRGSREELVGHAQKRLFDGVLVADDRDATGRTSTAKGLGKRRILTCPCV
jgi:hypothetical protein